MECEVVTNSFVLCASSSELAAVSDAFVSITSLSSTNSQNETAAPMPCLKRLPKTKPFCSQIKRFSVCARGRQPQHHGQHVWQSARSKVAECADVGDTSVNKSHSNTCTLSALNGWIFSGDLWFIYITKS